MEAQRLSAQLAEKARRLSCPLLLESLERVHTLALPMLDLHSGLIYLRLLRWLGYASPLQEYFKLSTFFRLSIPHTL